MAAGQDCVIHGADTQDGSARALLHSSAALPVPAQEPALLYRKQPSLPLGGHLATAAAARSPWGWQPLDRGQLSPSTTKGYQEFAFTITCCF